MEAFPLSRAAEVAGTVVDDDHKGPCRLPAAAADSGNLVIDDDA
jgi:hypothetical protein